MADTHSAATDIRIARLKPVGREAEETFSRLIESDDLSNFHKQFMFITPYDSATSSSENPFDADDESFRQPQPRREDTPKKLWAGHYLLSTDCTGKAPPSIGWRVGKGTSKLEDRGVDFLLIPPGLPSRKVAVYHALIQFHPKSGVLLIKGVSKTLPVEYYVDNKPLLLYAGDVHVLYQAVNRFRLGKLEYHFVYEDLDNDQYTDYVRIRNEALHAAGAEIPSPRLLALPRRPHMKHGDIILHESLNSGAFGLVCAAVDARTGAPLAMKEIWIKNKNMLKDNGLKAERKVATQFTVSMIEVTQPCRVLPIYHAYLSAFLCDPLRCVFTHLLVTPLP